MNAQEFLTYLYDYYLYCGTKNYILSRIVYLLKYSITVLFLFVLLETIDFENLKKDLQHSEDHVFLGNYISLKDSINFFSVILFGGFLFFFVWKIFGSWKDIRNMLAVRKEIYAERCAKELQTMEWGEFCTGMIPVMNRKFPSQHWDELQMVNSIMRKENYIMGMVQSHILQTETFREWNPLIFEKRPVITKTLEKTLRMGVLAFVFDSSTGKVRKNIMNASTHDQNARFLTIRLRIMAILGLILSPFVLVYMLFEFFLEHGEMLRPNNSTSNTNIRSASSNNSLSMRQWSNDCGWIFRGYNELPHLFHRRMALAQVPAEEYVNYFVDPLFVTAARFVSYASGSVVAVLILFAIWGDDEVLTRVDLAGGKSGVWWLGVCGAILAASRALIPFEPPSKDPIELLQAVVAHTHYFHSSWKGKEKSVDVKAQVCKFFEYRWYQYGRELLSILYTPYLLYFYLPSKSGALLHFFKKHTEPTSGECSYGMFDLHSCGGEKKTTIKMESSMRLFRSSYFFDQHQEPVRETELSWMKDVNSSFSSEEEEESAVGLEDSESLSP